MDNSKHCITRRVVRAILFCGYTFHDLFRVMDEVVKGYCVTLILTSTKCFIARKKQTLTMVYTNHLNWYHSKWKNLEWRVKESSIVLSEREGDWPPYSTLLVMQRREQPLECLFRVRSPRVWKEKQFSEVDTPEIFEVQRVNRCYILIFNIFMYIPTIQSYQCSHHTQYHPCRWVFLPFQYTSTLRSISAEHLYCDEVSTRQLEGCKRTSRE